MTTDTGIIALTSDHLEGYSYDEDINVLTIYFTDGSVYAYDDVPKDIAHGLKTSGSASGYFRSYIKGRYKYYRL